MSIITDFFSNIFGTKGFLWSLFTKQVESAFGNLFQKEFADEGALEWALAQAEETQANISADVMEILSKLNEYENEQFRNIMGVLVTLDKETSEKNKDWKAITPRVLTFLVRDLKGKSADVIRKRLSLIESPFWKRVFEEHISPRWPELLNRIKKFGKYADTASLRFVLGDEYDTIRATRQAAGETPQQIREELLRQARSRLPATPAIAQARVREARRNARSPMVMLAKVVIVIAILYVILEPIVMSAMN